MFEVANALIYVSAFSAAIPLLLVVIHREIVNQRYFTWLILLLLTSFVIDIVSRVIIILHVYMPTTYLVNFYYITEFILLLLIYREFYLKEKRALVILVTIIYLGFEIVNSIFFQKPSVSQTWSWALSGLIFIGLSIGYFAHLSKSNPLVDITEFAPSWINIAVFIYFGFSLYLFTMAEYVFNHESTENAIIFWGFHNVNNILKNCLFAVAIYWGGRTTQVGYSK